MYIRRDIEDYIRSAASSFQAIVIYGPRQVGKSTTVDMIFGDKFKYVTLVDTNERELALSNPKGFWKYIHGLLLLMKCKKLLIF